MIENKKHQQISLQFIERLNVAIPVSMNFLEIHNEMIGDNPLQHILQMP